MLTGDPFSPLYPLYIQMVDLLNTIKNSVENPVPFLTEYSWTIIAMIFLYKGIMFKLEKKLVEKRRIQAQKNGMRRIRSQMWLGLANDFVQQALAASALGFLSILTPAPVRPQLTILEILVSATLIFIMYKSYMMVNRVNQADRDVINYAKEKFPNLAGELSDDYEVGEQEE